MTDINVPKGTHETTAGGSPGNDRGEIMQCFQRALAESYWGQRVKCVVAEKLDNGRVVLIVEDQLPVYEASKRRYLIGTTDAKGSELLIHPAWAEWLAGETSINPTSRWYLSQKRAPDDHDTIRSYEGNLYGSPEDGSSGDDPVS